MRHWFSALACAALWAFSGPALAQTTSAAPEAVPPADYSVDANWLCRPGRHDACAQDESTTVLAADGHMTRENFQPNPTAPIDCFYVYPTVSLDPGGNSDLVPGPEEFAAAQVQFARFAAQCRPFAPVYRQNTLTSLRARLTGGTFTPPDRLMAYSDVVAAWRYYLAHDSHGRGVVLIGHSQGSAILVQLMRDEIDGKPVMGQLVSAIILGANVIVPDGADVGGTFQHIPPCRSAIQTGCVISYTSFRDTAPPPPVGIFAHAYDPQTLRPLTGMHALCTNPANLAGGSGALHSFFPTSFGQRAPLDFAWTNPPRAIGTAFVTTPGLVSAQCVTDGPSTYLSIHVNAGPNDVRTHDIYGDVREAGRLLPDWGLHLIDVPEAMGNLVDLVGREGAAYTEARR